MSFQQAIDRYRFVHVPIYNCPNATRMIQIQIERLLMVAASDDKHA